MLFKPFVNFPLFMLSQNPPPQFTSNLIVNPNLPF